MVISKTIYTPQQFCEAMTGECYSVSSEDTCEQIYRILRREGVVGRETSLRSYALDEIERIAQEGTNVVLVDVSGFYQTDDWETVYRWFEVTGFESRIDPKWEDRQKEAAAPKRVMVITQTRDGNNRLLWQVDVQIDPTVEDLQSYLQEKVFEYVRTHEPDAIVPIGENGAEEDTVLIPVPVLEQMGYKVPEQEAANGA